MVKVNKPTTIIASLMTDEPRHNVYERAHSVDIVVDETYDVSMVMFLEVQKPPELSKRSSANMLSVS